MDLIPIFLHEMEQEAATTRKFLSRVPADKFDWRPHPKSMTLMQLTTHIAELPSWVSLTLHTDELDFATVPYQPTVVSSTDELLAILEKALADEKDALEAASEDILTKPWTLRDGDTIYSTTPKHEVIRMTHNQTTHHRAQLGVYLRLLDIPIPGSYGPSADEGF
jgi:uncharacterized damage-inducible protein DinB